MATAISSVQRFASGIWTESNQGTKISADLSRSYLTMPIAKTSQSRVLSCPVGWNSNGGTFHFCPDRLPMDESRKLKGPFSSQDVSVTFKDGCPGKCTLF
jgi:hypothetical protein